MNRDRVTGIVLSLDRHGNATARVDDRLYVVPASEAHRAGIQLQPGAMVSFRIDAKPALPLAVDPALAAEAAQ